MSEAWWDGFGCGSLLMFLILAALAVLVAVFRALVDDSAERKLKKEGWRPPPA